MDSKFIKPSQFGADPNAGQASKEWKHWYRTFTNFLESFPAEPPITEQEKLRCLVAHIDKDVYSYISECASYNDAISSLEGLYVKPCNIIFARHLLTTCKQQPGQSLDDFFQKLRQLSRDCDYKAVTAEVYRNEAIHDAFISGISSIPIRLRLLENTSEESMKLDAIFNQARSLDIAQRNSENFNLSQATTGFEDNSSLNATKDLPNVGRSLEREKQEVCNCTAATQSRTYENSTGNNLSKKCSRCGSWENIQLHNALPREASVLSVAILGTTPKSAVPAVKPLIILHQVAQVVDYLFW